MSEAERLESSGTKERGWDIAVACDARLGEIFGDPYGYGGVYVDINPAVIEQMLKDLGGEALGGSIVFTLKHANTIKEECRDSHIPEFADVFDKYDRTHGYTRSIKGINYVNVSIDESVKLDDEVQKTAIHELKHAVNQVDPVWSEEFSQFFNTGFQKAKKFTAIYASVPALIATTCIEFASSGPYRVLGIVAGLAIGSSIYRLEKESMIDKMTGESVLDYNLKEEASAAATEKLYTNYPPVISLRSR